MSRNRHPAKNGARQNRPLQNDNPRRHLVVYVSDLHAGSSVGLHPDTPTALDDGGEWTPSKAQRWLWANWCDFWDRVKRKRKGRRLHIFSGGDAVEGVHHRTTQLVSANMGTQMQVLMDCWKPILQSVKPDNFFVIRGTEAHVGTSATTEEGFARWIANSGVNVPRDPSNDQRSWWHFRGEIGGVRFDVAHHGRMGNRPWTKAGQVGNYAAQILMEHAEAGLPAPHLAIRSHRHVYADTHDLFPVRLIQSPAWQLATAFVHKVAPGAIADIGGHIIEIEDGKCDVETVRYRPDPVKPWVAR